MMTYQEYVTVLVAARGGYNLRMRERRKHYGAWISGTVVGTVLLYLVMFGLSWRLMTQDESSDAQRQLAAVFLQSGASPIFWACRHSTPIKFVTERYIELWIQMPFSLID